jgi:protein CpxP
MMITNQWKLAAGAALLALCSCAAFAQAAFAQSEQPQNPPPGADQGGPRGQMRRGFEPERELATLTHVLTLNPEQQTGVKAVLEQQATQMKALRDKAESTSPDGPAPETRQARMTQMEQIRDESNTKISALLDENQKKTFADWVQKRKAEMARRGPRGGNPQPDGAGTPPPSPNQ